MTIPKNIYALIVALAFCLVAGCATAGTSGPPYTENAAWRAPAITPNDTFSYTFVGSQTITLTPDAANLVTNGYVAYTVNEDKTPNCYGFNETKIYSSPFQITKTSKVIAVYCDPTAYVVSPSSSAKYSKVGL